MKKLLQRMNVVRAQYTTHATLTIQIDVAFRPASSYDPSTALPTVSSIEQSPSGTLHVVCKLIGLFSPELDFPGWFRWTF